MRRYPKPPLFKQAFAMIMTLVLILNTNWPATAAALSELEVSQPAAVVEQTDAQESDELDTSENVSDDAGDDVAVTPSAEDESASVADTPATSDETVVEADDDTDSDGTDKTPVVLHRAILGSLDRFMAYLIEETKGIFPVWLAPLQVKVLPVSEKSLDYAEGVYKTLRDAGIRVELDDRNEKSGYKIRAARQEDKVPYMIVVGEKEAADGTISVRARATDQTEASTVEEFKEKVLEEIRQRVR